MAKTTVGLSVEEKKELRMKPRLVARLQAKKMVNRIYQPLGKLMCHVSSDDMWEWAKERTKEELDILLDEIPMYQGNLNPNWKYWDEVRTELKNLP